ncbi:MAG: hypothetical protein JOY66_23170, partial [Acetobacteraceae bacterium]|nr:hypothetical protein [Acetobacteraceae bacterium]
AVGEAAIFDAITRQRALVEGAQAATKAARRSALSVGGTLATPTPGDGGQTGAPADAGPPSSALPIYGVEEWDE